MVNQARMQLYATHCGGACGGPGPVHSGGASEDWGRPGAEALVEVTRKVLRAESGVGMGGSWGAVHAVGGAGLTSGGARGRGGCSGAGDGVEGVREAGHGDGARAHGPAGLRLRLPWRVRPGPPRGPRLQRPLPQEMMLSDVYCGRAVLPALHALLAVLAATDGARCLSSTVSCTEQFISTGDNDARLDNPDPDPPSCTRAIANGPL